MSLLILFLIYFSNASILSRNLKSACRIGSRAFEFVDCIRFRPRLGHRMHRRFIQPQTYGFEMSFFMDQSTNVDKFSIVQNSKVSVQIAYGDQIIEYLDVVCANTSFKRIRERACTDFSVPVCANTELKIMNLFSIYIPIFNEHLSVCSMGTFNKWIFKLVNIS